MGYETTLSKINNAFLPQITHQLQGNGIAMTDYQRQCVLNAITSINNLLKENGMTVNQVSSNLTDILLTVAALQLNASADPREVYFILRNHKRGDGSKVKEVEMGIEGDGNDSLLSRFGRNVKEVKRFWLVRENDEFEYPGFNGLEMTPPKWRPKGTGKVIRVVYPIIRTDDSVDFYIAEREDVKKNLLAHVANNLMWDKNGAKDKFMSKAEDMSLDEILNDSELVKLGKISPAWSSPQARESMIIRKMRNNVVKKIPKNFENAFVARTYESANDEEYRKMRKVVNENANSIEFEDEPQQLPEETPKHDVPAHDDETGEIIGDKPQEEKKTKAQKETEADPF
ncbi:MAG: hypothetical protein ABF690_13150 [Liquorilactobacillus nagelii]|uniref:hypothetical protein n=1 Tax=Lactobacillaceae TaxID=33958 RepID=UPI0039EC4EB7